MVSKKKKYKIVSPAMHQLQPRTRVATARNHRSHIPFRDTQVLHVHDTKMAQKKLEQQLEEKEEQP